MKHMLLQMDRLKTSLMQQHATTGCLPQIDVKIISHRCLHHASVQPTTSTLFHLISCLKKRDLHSIYLNQPSLQIPKCHKLRYPPICPLKRFDTKFTKSYSSGVVKIYDKSLEMKSFLVFPVQFPIPPLLAFPEIPKAWTQPLTSVVFKARGGLLRHLFVESQAQVSFLCVLG